jgi:hypothetical protein
MNVYAEVDLELKAKALASCEMREEGTPQKPWREHRRGRPGQSVADLIGLARERETVQDLSEGA